MIREDMGKLNTDGLHILSFNEKTKNDAGYINSGVAIFDKKIVDYISTEILFRKRSLSKIIKKRL